MILGEVRGYHREGNRIYIETEETELILRFITDDIVNVFLPVEYPEQDSKAIENLQEKEVNLSVIDGEVLEIKTESIIVEVDSPLALTFKDFEGNIINRDYQEGAISTEEPLGVFKKLDPEEHFYGFGEKTGYLDKAGDSLEMWNSDIPAPHVTSMKALYKSIPFFIGFKKGRAYGIFFDNTYKTYFDMGKESEEYYSFTANGGNIDYYFIAGPAIKDVIKNYTYLTGRMNLPPLWTLGYQQCRWSYFPENQVMEIAQNMREKEIPCDVIYLDIDYMDGYRVFTWDDERFPNPQEMIAKLREDGFKVITIVDPGVKKDKDYWVYNQCLENGYYVRDKDGAPFVGKVWPGDCLFPDFTDKETRQWWGSLHQELLDVGVAAIWNDMNEPAVFTDESEHQEPDEVKTMPLSNFHKNDGRETTHAEMHNVYGLMMSKATYQSLEQMSDKRPFVLTRAGYAGIQKYSAFWTGDNQSFWEHLRLALPMLMNLGLSGVPFIGTDVGGFSYDCTGELLSRWVQLGCFTPLFRNHSAWGTRDQEPWAFDQKTEEINRKYIRLRYKMMPYIYNLFVEASRTGLPLMRPLVLEYPEDEEVYRISDQFMFGQDILIAPIVTPATEYRHLYLPEGRWYNYWTGEVYQGNNHIMVHAPLDTLPIFIKAGSIIPNFEPMNYIGEKSIETLIVDIYPGNGKYSYYEDDGETFEYREGKYNLIDFGLEDSEGELTLNINQKTTGFDSKLETYRLQLNSIEPEVILVDGQQTHWQQVDHKVIIEVEKKDQMVIKIRK